MELLVKDICKSFGEKRVLEGIDLQVQSGRAVGLLGRNGAGKTTTIRIIMGVFPPDSGRVTIDGKGFNSRTIPVGYLPEEHGLYPKIEITNQLVYLAELRGMKSKAAKASIEYWLKRFGMSEYANKKLMTLSKGNQQKIQLAATLMTNPDLVILDEPFSGLDPVNAALLKDAVKELIANNKLVLFSSHQMSYVEEFCDSITILHEGKIVLEGGIKEIKRSYDRSIMVIRSDYNKEIEAFCSGLNFVTSVESKNGELFVKLRDSESKNAFMSALAAGSFDIDSVGVWEPSLSDIFVQYTGEREEGVELA